jgi:hypothetical protein
MISAALILKVGKPVQESFQNGNHEWPAQQQWAKPFVLQERFLKSISNSETGISILYRASRQHGGHGQ